MKKIITKTTFLLFSFLAVASVINAQVMGNFDNSQVNWKDVVEHTAKGEQEGKILWDKLQSKKIQCTDLSNNDFDVLGEYFMGRMMGNSHVAMNVMMMQAQGEQGEEQIHIIMGKRLSGCDTSATVLLQNSGWMPMMQMMWGGWSSPFGFNSTNNMMNFDYSFGLFGWIFMILWLGLIIVAVIALVKWLVNQFRGGISSKNALDILKERYAKGEISGQEFEDKKRELVS